jgi:hypothetical protein
MPLTHSMCSPFACTFELLQVTSIRVQGDERENLRRIQAETRRQERRQKLLYEAESRWRTAQPALLAGQAPACCRDHCPDAISENFTQSLAPLAGAKSWATSQCLGGARLCGAQR